MAAWLLRQFNSGNTLACGYTYSHYIRIPWPSITLSNHLQFIFAFHRTSVAEYSWAAIRFSSLPFHNQLISFKPDLAFILGFWIESLKAPYAILLGVFVPGHQHSQLTVYSLTLDQVRPFNIPGFDSGFYFDSPTKLEASVFRSNSIFAEKWIEPFNSTVGGLGTF